MSDRTCFDFASSCLKGFQRSSRNVKNHWKMEEIVLIFVISYFDLYSKVACLLFVVFVSLFWIYHFYHCFEAFCYYLSLFNHDERTCCQTFLYQSFFIIEFLLTYLIYYFKSSNHLALNSLSLSNLNFWSFKFYYTSHQSLTSLSIDLIYHFVISYHHLLIWFDAQIHYH